MEACLLRGDAKSEWSLVDAVHNERYEEFWGCDFAKDLQQQLSERHAINSSAEDISPGTSDSEDRDKEVADFLTCVLDVSRKHMERGEPLLFAILCLRLFVRCNCSGPPLRDEEKCDLPSWLVDEQSQLTRQARLCLAMEGNLLQELMYVPMALYLAWNLFTSIDFPITSLDVWRARVAITLQRSIIGGRRNPVVALRALSVDRMFAFLKRVKVFSQDLELPGVNESLETPDETPVDASLLTPDARQALLLEFTAALGTYGLVKAFQTALVEGAKETLGFTASLTGRLGLKRKFQQDAIAQLVIQIDKQSEPAEDKITSTEETLDKENDTETETAGVVAPRTLTLKDFDPDTDMLERPKFTADEVAAEIEELSLQEQLLLLAWGNVILESSPADDELAAEVVKAIVTECVRVPEKNSETPDEFSKEAGTSQEGTERATPKDVDPILTLNWLVFSQGLWLRSRAEFNNIKMKERACLQILELETQFREAAPSSGHRQLYVFQLDYPNIWEIRSEVGFKFVKLGATLTAKKMFEEMHMWDECIGCLLAAGRKNEARDLVNERLKDIASPSPTLICALADIEDSRDLYLRAWEESNQKLGRSARSLGKLCFQAGDIDGCIEWFGHALRLQPQQMNTQFTYGSCLMRRGRLQEALSAFGRVVAIDEQQSEAWANMAACHSQLDQWMPAKKCIERAARGNHRNWRIWDNYVKLSVKTGDVNSAMYAMDHIVTVGQGDKIETWMLNHLARSVIHGEAETESAETSSRFLERVLEFFSKFFLRATPNVEDVDILGCCDKFRVWSLVTEVAGQTGQTFEIRMKALRHWMRTAEHVLEKGCGRQPTEEEEMKFFGLYTQCANELLALLPALKTKAPSR